MAMYMLANGLMIVHTEKVLINTLTVQNMKAIGLMINRRAMVLNLLMTDLVMKDNTVKDIKTEREI